MDKPLRMAALESIPFHRKSAHAAVELAAIKDALVAGYEAGGGPILARVEAALARAHGLPDAVLCTSGTHALELLALTSGLEPGAEVIVPSFTHPSTANAFFRAGFRLRFADSSAHAPHLCAADVARKASAKTKAVVVVHYAGGGQGLAELEALCRSEGYLFLEDAAQAFGARQGSRPLGTIGQGAALSFHQTKNIGCGEGGALLPCDAERARSARIAREMGTTRHDYRLGLAAGYEWVADGSSYMPSDLLTALLEVRLQFADDMIAQRRSLFDAYAQAFHDLNGEVKLPCFDADALPNGHSFFVGLASEAERLAVRNALRDDGIASEPHYRALHATPRGRELSAQSERDLPHALAWRDGLLRLPLWPGMELEAIGRVRESFGRALRRARA